jgi:5S rRNA maturation endonuclease (ribonuclease M5)
MKQMIIGDIYMIKLKQTSKKGFSARSTGALSKKGVPVKSYKMKNSQDLYSTTPIRIGIDENLNSLIGTPSDMIAKLHLFYRSSVIGRRDLGKRLIKNLKMLDDFRYEDNIKNRNVEILQAYLKSMGLRIKFIGNKYNIDVEIGDIKTFEDDEKLFIGTESDYKDYKLKKKIKKKCETKKCFVGTKEEFNKMIDDEYELEKIKRDKLYIDIKL